MSLGLIHGIYTLTFMATFIAFGLFVFSPRRKHHYDEAANLPFGEDENGSGDSRTRDQGEHKKS